MWAFAGVHRAGAGPDRSTASPDRLFRSDAKDQIIRPLVSGQIMLDLGLKGQSQVPDIQFPDDHVQPQIEF